MKTMASIFTAPRLPWPGLMQRSKVVVMLRCKEPKSEYKERTQSRSHRRAHVSVVSETRKAKVAQKGEVGRRELVMDDVCHEVEGLCNKLESLERRKKNCGAACSRGICGEYARVHKSSVLSQNRSLANTRQCVLASGDVAQSASTSHSVSFTGTRARAGRCGTPDSTARLSHIL